MMVSIKIITLTDGVFNVYRCNYTYDANIHMIITIHMLHIIYINMCVNTYDTYTTYK